MKKTLLSVCSLIYVASLCFPVFQPAEGEATYILGIIALLFGWGNFQWFANPLLVVSHVFLFARRYNIAVVFSGVSVILGLSTLLMNDIPRDSSGQMTTIDGYGLAFYLWMTSLLLTFVGSLCCLVVCRKRKNLVEQD